MKKLKWDNGPLALVPSQQMFSLEI